jgi:hypothetical protein
MGTHSIQLSQQELEFLDGCYDITGDRQLLPRPDIGSQPTEITLRNWLLLQQQNSQPIFYNLEGDKIYIVPASSSADHDIRVYFYNNDGPDLVNDTDTPDIPDRYHDAIVSGALSKAALDDANLDGAVKYYQEFTQILAQAFSELRPKGAYWDDVARKLAMLEAMRGGRTTRARAAAGG